MEENFSKGRFLHEVLNKNESETGGSQTKNRMWEIKDKPGWVGKEIPFNEFLIDENANFEHTPDGIKKYTEWVTKLLNENFKNNLPNYYFTIGNDSIVWFQEIVTAKDKSHNYFYSEELDKLDAFFSQYVKIWKNSYDKDKKIGFMPDIQPRDVIYGNTAQNSASRIILIDFDLFSYSRSELDFFINSLKEQSINKHRWKTGDRNLSYDFPLTNLEISKIN